MFLIKTKLDIPTYFTFEDDSVAHLCDVLSEGPKGAIDVGRASINAAGSEPYAMKKPLAANIQAVLPATAEVGTRVRDGVSPIIAIVTHYDTFAVAPGIPAGANTQGSGVAAMLELVRLWSQLYAER